ncbi:MAG TPA: hypothetical protein VFY03_07070 [Woeseiaceae bacterium]|nr:hypothetical protein [Woeseiaceae bacterium]
MATQRPTFVVAAWLCAALLPWTARTEDAYVPDSLEEWRAWVLEDRQYLGCPRYFDRAGSEAGDHVCVWPAALALDIHAGGGSFAQRWLVSAGSAWLPLPGDTDHWPEAVTANGERLPVVLHEGAPSVRLGAGTWRLAGRFEWTERPGVLRVPPENGLLNLVVDGQAIARPVVNQSGVFLGDSGREEKAADTIDAAVYRLVADDAPLFLVTRLKIDVAGAVREVTFGPLLPGDYVPQNLSSALPVRLESDGRLRAQVRPGSFEVTLVARAPGVETAVPVPAGRDNLPDEEIWSFQANDRLRVAAPAGAMPVDPDQADVPAEWSGLPAFRLVPGEALEIVERSRGQTPVGNDLALSRELWLDFNGGGLTVRDWVTGRMREGWRLDMHPPYTLESASEDGDNLLVTAGDEPGSTGVEIRRTDVDLEATARSDAVRSLPVTGWEARFATVDATLYLPPGNLLLAAPGADAAVGSWTNRWQLLDFFLVLIITIASLRLFGRAGGLLAFAALVLCFHEYGAPTWLWLNLLIAVALLRVAPASGRLRIATRGYAAFAVILLAFALVPFVAGQLRIAIYPQLEPQANVYSAWEPAAPPAALEVTSTEGYAADEAADADRRQPAAIEEVVVTGVRSASAVDFPRYAPNAIVQTGPGIPDWQWNSAELTWNGPVEPGQSLRLIVVPRWAVALLRIAEVGLLLAFAAVILVRTGGGTSAWPRIARRTGHAAAAAVLAGVFLVNPDVAGARAPAPELLHELERRLTRAPDCAPRCAEIAQATVRIEGNGVTLLLSIEALADVAVPMPGTAGGWRPDAVELDVAAAEVLRAANERLWVRVPAGRHAVRLSGTAGDADSLEIAFPAPPRVVEVVANGWSVAGLEDRRLVSGALQFSRQREAAAESPARWESSRFPSFAEVERTLDMGLDWTVSTSVRRIAPEEGALTLRIPLLPGESVLSEQLPVAEGEILVSMAPGQNEVSWASRLPRTSPLTLAADDKPWKEIWRVRSGSVWGVDFEGVPESVGSGAESGVRSAEFHPREGERLTISATRPEPVAGDTLAIDAVRLRIDQGEHSRNGRVAFDYRSTRGAQHVLTLPASAELLRVGIDGETEPLRIEEGAVTLPVLPGEHSVEVEWRDGTPAGVVTRVPEVDLGAPAGNLELELQLPASRWLLLTRGPTLGPSVLYWSELAALVLFAFLLSRIEWTPLRFRHWLLLGLGFSTFNWAVPALVAAWLIATGARERWRRPLPRRAYNALQVGLALLTFAALVAIVVSLPAGLLGSPDMHVTGNDSTRGVLRWFGDRSAGMTPAASAWSVPLWVYKALILAWALWLSLALIRWLPWAWRVLAHDGYFAGKDAERVPGA